MIVVVDFGMGNLGSVLKSLNRLKVQTKISTSIKDIEMAEKLILPGVGHYSNGMKQLHSRNYIDSLNDKVLNEGTPILGICLGMQLFSRYSHEGKVAGLGWVDAEVVRFEIEDKVKWKIPHMGWNSVSIKKDSILLSGVDEGELFYFVHSYHMSCNDNEDILGATRYGYEFTSAIQRGNIYGTQFHPEKSHDKGLEILNSFVHKV
jgi:imidazole glycerol-phosphate synthase subunit HisH